MTFEQERLLRALGECLGRGSHAMACDGAWRKPAHELEEAGYATWCGVSWGSSFWCLTEAGVKAFESLRARLTADHA